MLDCFLAQRCLFYGGADYQARSAIQALNSPARTQLCDVTWAEKLGFSTCEARAYLALLRKSPVTGYQLGKRSSIPRSWNRFPAPYLATANRLWQEVYVSLWWN